MIIFILYKINQKDDYIEHHFPLFTLPISLPALNLLPITPLYLLSYAYPNRRNICVVLFSKFNLKNI